MMALMPAFSSVVIENELAEINSREEELWGGDKWVESHLDSRASLSDTSFYFVHINSTHFMSSHRSRTDFAKPLI